MTPGPVYRFDMALALKRSLLGSTLTKPAGLSLVGREPHPAVKMEISEEDVALLREWAERGPQGPISDEDAELP